MVRLRLVLGAMGLAVSVTAAFAVTAGAALQAWRDAAAPGPARAEDLVAAFAGLVAVTLAGWLALAVLASAGEAVLAGTGRRCPLAAAMAPQTLRRWVAALLGAGVVGMASPLAAGAAVQSGLPFGPPAAVSMGTTARTAAGTAAGTDSAAGAEALDPGWAPAPAPAPAPAADRKRPAAAPPAPALRASTLADGDVVVRRGDTLWAVAARHLGPAAGAAEVAEAWPRWYAANRAVIGPDPDHIEPGMRLLPPTRTTGGTR